MKMTVFLNHVGKEPACVFQGSVWICQDDRAYGVGHLPCKAREQWRYAYEQNLQRSAVDSCLSLQEKTLLGKYRS